jgi:SAM-dependent methyltransferase
MARRFPHVCVLGIDLSPRTPNPDTDPRNVEFQVYDINNGMKQFYGQFDMIQMRCVGSGIKDIYKSFNELLLSLKPGGFITIIDGDRTINEDRSRYLEMKAIEGDEGVTASISKDGSWFQRICFGVFYLYSYMRS